MTVSLACSHLIRLFGSQYYDVESVLGKEVGPVNGYVRVITRTPGLWVGLEEVCI